MTTKDKFSNVLTGALEELSETLVYRKTPGDQMEFFNEWEQIAGRGVQDCILQMIALKMARVKHNKSVEDSLLDIAGYAILALVVRRMKDE